MGARGKKRRRKDGSTAVGKLAPTFNLNRGSVPHEWADPVSPDLLAAAVAITHRHIPLGLDERDDCLDALFEDIHHDIDQLAAQHGVDGISLATRGEKLADYLSAGGRTDQYAVSDDGAVSIDRALLEHAASSPVNNSNDPLVWAE